jgi:hypothetical protein
MIEYRRDPKNPRELKPAISAEQVERRRAHVRIAIADNRIEGIATSAATLEICEAYIRGEIEAADLVTVAAAPPEDATTAPFSSPPQPTEA